MVIATELIRRALPLSTSQFRRQCGRDLQPRPARGPALVRGIECQQAIRVFRLDPLLVRDAQQRRCFITGDVCEQPAPPTEAGRGEYDCADGMAHVVMAVAEGPLSVLPGLAPVDGGEADEKGVAGEPVAKRRLAVRRRRAMLSG